jgi:ribosomal protein S13
VKPAGRSELLAALKTGTTSLADVLARDDEIAKKTKVTAVLKSLSCYGPAKATALMSQANISDQRRIGGLGEQQRQKLLTAVDS